MAICLPVFLFTFFFSACLFIFQIWALVLEDHYNPRLVKELLQDLSSTLHSLTVHVGRCVLVGNVNIWLCRLETIQKWQQQLNNLQIPKVGKMGQCMCVSVHGSACVCPFFVHPQNLFQHTQGLFPPVVLALVSTHQFEPSICKYEAC